MAFILFTVNCRPLEASPSESRAACESGRDLKTFQSRLKPYLWPNRPEKSEPLRRIWWVSTGRSAWMPAWSRSTLDPETWIPKFSSTTWTASFGGLLRNFVSSAYILTTMEMRSLDWSSKRPWLQKENCIEFWCIGEFLKSFVGFERPISISKLSNLFVLMTSFLLFRFFKLIIEKTYN